MYSEKHLTEDSQKKEFLVNDRYVREKPNM